MSELFDSTTCTQRISRNGYWMLGIYEQCFDRWIDMSLHSSAADMRTLVGHSGPVYSTSFNPDNTLLLSGSEDGTGQFE